MNYEMDCNVEEHSKTHNDRCREQTPSPQYTVYASEIDCEDYTSLPKSHEDNLDHSKDQQITELEMQVASLSAIVEKRTHLTNNLLLRKMTVASLENRLFLTVAVNTSTIRTKQQLPLNHEVLTIPLFIGTKWHQPMPS